VQTHLIQTFCLMNLKSHRCFFTKFAGAYYYRNVLKAKSNPRPFIATGNWLPIHHCVGNEGGENGISDMQVDLQQLSTEDYDYCKLCSKSNILEHKRKLDEERDEAERLKQLERTATENEEREFENANAHWREQGEIALTQENQDSIKSTAKGILHHFVAVESLIPGNVFFVIGSWPAHLVAEKCSTATGKEALDLQYSNINIYQPTINPCITLDLKLFPRSLKTVIIAEVPKEICAIKCSNPSLSNLLQNNDINATGAGFKCTVIEDRSLSIEIKVDTSFWKFLFGDRMLEVKLERRHSARSLVRLAWKGFQMNLE